MPSYPQLSRKSSHTAVHSYSGKGRIGSQINRSLQLASLPTDGLCLVGITSYFEPMLWPSSLRHLGRGNGTKQDVKPAHPTQPFSW